MVLKTQSHTIPRIGCSSTILADIVQHHVKRILCQIPVHTTIKDVVLTDRLEQLFVAFPALAIKGKAGLDEGGVAEPLQGLSAGPNTQTPK